MIDNNYAVYGTFIVYLLLMLGLPGYAFGSGMEAIWLAGGLLVGTWGNWMFTAKRLRTYSIEANDALTLPEFFANRFHDRSRLLQVISAFFILLFFLFYTSSGLVAGGKLFETVFGLEYTTALVIGTVCIVSYTLFGGFHPVIAGILLAAILAAIMSTADSQLLVSSSALAEDFYKQLLRKHASQQEVVMVGRLAVIGLSIVAMLLAFDPESTVLGLVSYAWAGFGAAFGPALLISLYWQRMTRNGALAGIVVGAVTVVVWKQLSSGIYDMYEIVPGIILATLAIVVVSLVDKAPGSAVQEQHQRMLKSL